MWKLVAAMSGSLALALVLSPAHAAKDVPLPCGDYDGVPSHNDCWKVSDKKKQTCQIWIDAGNGTDDPARKEKYKEGYFDCVDWPGEYSPKAEEMAPEDAETEDMSPEDMPSETPPEDAEEPSGEPE
jgi:hypothetical protein